MPNVYFRCTYCDRRFESYIYNLKIESNRIQCPDCKSFMKEQDVAENPRKDAFGYDDENKEK